MMRLRIPPPCCDFILNLFTSRTNQMITAAEITKPYEVLIGIDQGEVISPLLWTIYYDPLLCEIQNLTLVILCPIHGHLMSPSPPFLMLPHMSLP